MDSKASALDSSLRKAFEAVLGRATFEPVSGGLGLAGLLDSGACDDLLAEHREGVEAVVDRLLQDLAIKVDDHERATVAGRLLRHLRTGK